MGLLTRIDSALRRGSFDEARQLIDRLELNKTGKIARLEEKPKRKTKKVKKDVKSE